VPPVAFWASQSLVVDLESGTAALHNPFADQLQFGTATKAGKPTARSCPLPSPPYSHSTPRETHPHGSERSTVSVWQLYARVISTHRWFNF